MPKTAADSELRRALGDEEKDVWAKKKVQMGTGLASAS